MNYHNKNFKSVENSENGEINEETVFSYQQMGNIVTSEYKRGQIIRGNLIGIVDDLGNIEMRYHQVNLKGELLTGVYTSKPEIMKNGKIRLDENWKWTSGDYSSGKSVIEEI